MSTKTKHTLPDALEGWSCDLSNTDDRQAILPLALDYRGDVTLWCEKNGPVVGFVFNVSRSEVTLLRPEQVEATRIPIDRIVRITFSGRDAANGKSWEAWLEKVAQAEARGEVAELYPDECE
jgi:hypothetical protein